MQLVSITIGVAPISNLNPAQNNIYIYFQTQIDIENNCTVQWNTASNKETPHFWLVFLHFWLQTILSGAL